ncbi:ArsI/CadI family heavy metal resistance metalloenzyme [Aquabacterium sp.]|uniref:ArsI/CadI family heavy metal resistance metalloenzyme n=1 Tax=Aquabacterium sp. TaxID=1872578 RepID=UPI003D6D5BF7
MKRFHVHVHVTNLDQSIDFYAKMFEAQPTRTESDYAKWMLDDPPLNFAISARGGQVGVDHLGIQADTAEELLLLKEQAQRADLALVDTGEGTCCYARSEKHWITDPQGVAWEHFHTLSNVPVFREEPGAAAPGQASHPAPVATACCPPANLGRPIGIPVKSSPSCC